MEEQKILRNFFSCCKFFQIIDPTTLPWGGETQEIWEWMEATCIREGYQLPQSGSPEMNRDRCIYISKVIQLGTYVGGEKGHIGSSL